MKAGYLSIALAGAALTMGAGTAPVQAQDAPALTSTAQSEAAQRFIGLPPAELSALLSDSTADLIAGLVTAAIMTDAETEIGALVTANSQPEALRPVAAVMIGDLGGRCAMLEPEALEAMVAAVMSFDRRTAEDLVRLGNAADAECAAQLAPALVTLTDGEDSMIASAIETALAIEGGLMMRMVSVLRGEVDVAAIESGVVPVSVPSLQPVTPGSILDSGAAEDSPAVRQHRRNAGSFEDNMTEFRQRNRSAMRLSSGSEEDTELAELPDTTLPDFERDQDLPTDVSRVE